LRHGGIRVLVLVVAAAARLVTLRWMAEQPISEWQLTFNDGDMAAHWQWSGEILAGDVLGRDTYRPNPTWMREIATAETWDRWRGGKHVFFKAPLYPYLLAGMRRLVGDDVARVGLCQAALGVLNVFLIFLIADRCFGTAVAAVAGLGAAVYGPFLLYEALLLRDSLGVTVSLLLLWGLLRCTGPALRSWAKAGVLFALALLGRELVLPFGLVVLLWIARRFWSQWRTMGAVAGAFIVGVLLGLSPLIVRNVMVGAPPLAVSAIGPENIVYGHAVDTLPAEFHVPAAAARILQQADGRTSEVVRLTLATYQGDWRRLLRNEAARTAAIFSADEGPDNVNWYYFADRSMLLRFSLPYALVIGFGLVGIWLARREGRAGRGIVLAYLLVSLAGLQFAPLVGRYRLVPTSLLLIYGAVAVTTVGRAARAGRWRVAALPLAAALGLSSVSAWALRVVEPTRRCRPTEFVLAESVYLGHRRWDAAYGELRGAFTCLIALGPRDAGVPPEYRPLAVRFVQTGRLLGRTPDVVDVVRRLAAVYPSDPSLPQLIAAISEGGTQDTVVPTTR
jgi:4-amino-4-deoxy-L-arabinose transferase-like glycosyltransferase